MEESLQRPDSNWLIDVLSIALAFTGMVAYPATDSWEGHSLPDYVESLLELLLGDKGNVPLRRYAGWTGVPTRRNALLLNRKSIWYGLSV